MSTIQKKFPVKCYRKTYKKFTYYVKNLVEKYEHIFLENPENIFTICNSSIKWPKWPKRH